jgi:hypothetical protein
MLMPKEAISLRHINGSKLSCPLEYVLKEEFVNRFEMRHVEVAADRPDVQFPKAGSRRIRFEDVEPIFVLNVRKVAKDSTARINVRVRILGH